MNEKKYNVVPKAKRCSVIPMLGYVMVDTTIVSMFVGELRCIDG